MQVAEVEAAGTFESCHNSAGYVFATVINVPCGAFGFIVMSPFFDEINAVAAGKYLKGKGFIAFWFELHCTEGVSALYLAGCHRACGFLSETAFKLLHHGFGHGFLVGNVLYIKHFVRLQVFIGDEDEHSAAVFYGFGIFFILESVVQTCRWCVVLVQCEDFEVASVGVLGLLADELNVGELAVGQ